jgi:hypothetical protein
MVHAWRRRTLAHWATLVALVLSVLAPSVSHAVAAARGELAPWSVVCSAADSLRAGWPAPTQGDLPADLTRGLDHCPYCSLQHSHPGAPAPEPVAPLLRLTQAAPPALVLRAPRPLFAWSAAQPRAPPRTA